MVYQNRSSGGNYDVERDVSGPSRGEWGHQEATRLLAAGYVPRSPVSRRPDPSDYDVAAVARVALPTFTWLGKDGINTAAITQRLKEIGDVGYLVGDFSRMNGADAWLYLKDLRDAIRKDARMVCPNVLREIEADNRRRF